MEAATMKSTLDDLKARRSIRRYKKEQIKASELDAVLEAGTWAPTGAGSQSPVIVAVQDAAAIAEMEKLNAKVMGNPDAHTFYGAPTVCIVLVDKSAPTPVYDGSLVLGNMMNAAYAIGLGSCWIHRAKEVFASPEGKALLKKWGLDPEKYEGVGNCILGYADETPTAKPRKAGYVIKA
jgi:nitroreductase